jgi:hypothetical protein
LRNIVVDPFLIGAGAEIILKSMQAPLTQIKPSAKGNSNCLHKATLRHFRHCGTHFSPAYGFSLRLAFCELALAAESVAGLTVQALRYRDRSFTAASTIVVPSSKDA